jgi:hypothetical protein
MQFLNKIFNLFSKSAEAQIEQPCDIRKVRETVDALERDDATLQAYKTWRTTIACSEWLKKINEEHATFAKNCKFAPCQNDLIKFKQIKCCNTFELLFDEDIHSTRDFGFLFDHFKDALLENGYQLHTSDVRTYHCSETKKQTIERHYLKPTILNNLPNRFSQQTIEQLFGNVTITFHAKSGVPYSIQLRSAHFREAMFTPVRSFSELMTVLTKRS